jgi:hypothetical protein
MVFTLDMDDGALRALTSADEAAAHCKAVDVEDGYWLFFAEDGSPLEARFENATQSADPNAASPKYILQRAMSGRWLQERLEQVVTVEGCGLTTVAELVETLKVNRGKRASRG